ncbi:MAG: ROK family protein [Firmicutes bacterium HGW-Firmicutes-5]|nr:MAG: ROK family protein [Firmicutes bacterium HGW-Firmicutes-5]
MKYYLGLDLGGTNMAAGVVNEKFELLSRAERLTNVSRDTEEIIADMYEVSVEAVDKAGLSMQQMSSWGIGMPSYVNPKNHLLVRANNFGWVNLPIIDYLKKHTNLDIYIENDANCAALGETIAGVAKEYNDTLMLTVGTGLGSGIILDKKVYTGSDKMGAELGHTKLVYDGIKCSCGQKGCAESYCSTTALIRQMREALAEDKDSLIWSMCDMDVLKIDGKMIFSAAYQEDPLALKIIDQFVEYLSCALSSFITIFRPEVVIIGGGLAESGDLLFELLQQKTYKNTFAAKEIGIPEIIPANLGNDAGIIGAALLEKYGEKR